MKKFCKIWAWTWTRQESCAVALQHPHDHPGLEFSSTPLVQGSVCVVALVQVVPVVNVYIAYLSVVDLQQDILIGLGVQDHPTQVSLK